MGQGRGDEGLDGQPGHTHDTLGLHPVKATLLGKGGVPLRELQCLGVYLKGSFRIGGPQMGPRPQQAPRCISAAAGPGAIPGAARI